jgi:transcriptional regulator with XRE-family HTH domain
MQKNYTFCVISDIIKEKRSSETMKANEVMRVRRLELGLTQREIADRVGVTEATVSRWESGDIRNMRRDKIASLARALDISPAVLMDWEQYDAEAAERRKLARELSEWSNVAEIEHLRIALDLIKRLEQK